jgi:hypothetical protein
MAKRGSSTSVRAGRERKIGAYKGKKVVEVAVRLD